MVNKCLFCGNELYFYDGCLGYESLRCDKCKVDYTENSINVEDWNLIKKVV